MNILIIPSWYPSRSNNINGSFFREQAIALSRKGHNIIVLNATFVGRKDHFSKDNFHFKKYIDHNVYTYSYTTPAFGLTRLEKLSCKLFLRRVRKLIKYILNDFGTIDIIHAHSFNPAGYCSCIIGKELNVPVVVTEHSSGIIIKDISAFGISILKDCVDMAYSYICVGQTLKNCVIELTGTSKSIKVIPNMVSNIFNYKQGRGNQKTFSFLSVGVLQERKNFDLLITAFSKAFYGNTNIKLKIGGGGNLLSSLQSQINSLGMCKQIELCGQLSREDTAKQMQQCDAFVLASTNETFGVVYIEALACGKPIIGTRNGGADDIINDHNGILIDINDETQLVNALEQMHRNYEKFNSSVIAKMCKEKYSEKAISEAIIKIYEEGKAEEIN
jgi:glycosyltransferase involved in cell wall biosynthesis